MTEYKIQAIRVDNERDNFISVYIDGKMKMARSDHPNFNLIIQKVEANESEGLGDLFDPAYLAEKKFQRLSERVTVRNARVYFDSDEIDSSLTKTILRFMQEGEEFGPLVAYLENVMLNPQQESRDQLYGFLARNEITITDDGHVVLYKGVVRDREDNDLFRPQNAGHGIVDGEEFQHEYLPQRVGSVVEIPRSEVVHDPHSACHVGLHTATFKFAQGFSRQSTVLEVFVNPRDVVSVPYSDQDKIRCCRYKVNRVADSPLKQAVTKRPVEVDEGIASRFPEVMEGVDLAADPEPQPKKKCVKCKRTKTIDKFRKNTKNKDGHDGVCKKCRAAADRNRRK